MVQGKETKEQGITVKDSFLLVALAWLIVSIIGALPYYFTRTIPSFMDAFFESVSGFTTTGATILTDVEFLDWGLLFWRSLTQWIGGMGIIVLAVAILPQLSVGGLQMMKNEMPGPTFEQIKPRIKQTALSLWKIYFLFSGLAFVAFWIAGMPWFDALCHMFSTLGTGGFSTKNSSFAAFGQTIQFIAVVFMVLGATNFVLHYSWLRGDFKKLFSNSEWKFFIGVLIFCVAAVTCELVFRMNLPIFSALRISIFQVVSLGTSSGFVNADYNTWPMLSKGLLLLLMIVAGCAGSTAGGFKQMRLLLLLKRAQQTLTKYIYPKAVVPIKLEKHVIPNDVLHGVSGFFIIYIFLFLLASFLLMAFGVEVETAFSAVISSLSNIGPGFGQVGPTENYAFLPGVVKATLCACMLIGRLEIFTILVLFFPATWRR